MAYADYEFYRDNFHGNMNEADFLKYSGTASDFIDSATFGRITQEIMNDTVISEKIKRACCACAEAAQKHEYGAGSGISQEKTGEHSVSYAQVSHSEYTKALYGIAKTYLGDIYADGLKLMYRGV